MYQPMIKEPRIDQPIVRFLNMKKMLPLCTTKSCPDLTWFDSHWIELSWLCWLGLVCFGLGNVCTGGPFVYLCLPFRNYGWLCHHFGIVACHISHCGGLLQSLNDLWNEIIAHLVQRDVPLFSPLLACVKVAVVADKWLVYCIHFCATNWHY